MIFLIFLSDVQPFPSVLACTTTSFFPFLLFSIFTSLITIPDISALDDISLSRPLAGLSASSCIRVQSSRISATKNSCLLKLGLFASSPEAHSYVSPNLLNVFAVSESLLTVYVIHNSSHLLIIISILALLFSASQVCAKLKSCV